MSNHKTVPAILACLLALAACTKKEAKEAEPVAPVQVAALAQDSIRRLVEGDAVLFPIDQSAVAPKIGAPIRKFLIDRGDRVRAGQVLAVLENRDLIAAEAAAKGQVEQAQANLSALENAQLPESEVKAQTDVQSAQEQFDAAKKILESRQKLLQEGALARKQVDDAQVVFAQVKAQLDTAREHLRVLQSAGKAEQIKLAKAQLASAQAQYQSAVAQVAYSEVVTPIAGVIADRPLYPGEMASAGAPIATVMDVSRVRAIVNVPLVQATSVRTGAAATIRTSDGQTVQGRVTVVSPATDPASTTVQVWVEADNPGGRLKPGASVHVAILCETVKNAVVAPSAAILPAEEGGTMVLVVGADSAVHQKKVEVGLRDGDKVQILSGVSPGDQVVTVGGIGLEDNAKVRVVKPGEKEDEGEKK